ncbi:MAG: Lpg1974 family pore-forming outer membrane protein, partial [Alphaproteobacteria bacterium]
DTVFKLYEMPNRFAATAEVFFLRPSSDNQIYGGLNNSTNSNVQNLTVDSEYDPGFRLGFKYNLGSGFDVRAQYSFLRARSSSSATDPTNANRIFVGYYDNLSVSNATAKFKLDYDVLDFDAGLNFAIGSRVMMRAFTGLRYARLDQTMDATGVRSNGFVDNWKGNADIWGIGPRFGLEGKMRIAGGFNLFGMLGASAPIGSRSGKYVSTRVGNTPQGQTEASRVAVNPSMDATIGISYDYQINQTMAVAFAVGYMFEHWFNTRPITGMTGEGLNSRGNSLTLDGFFLRGMFKW